MRSARALTGPPALAPARRPSRRLRTARAVCGFLPPLGAGKLRWKIYPPAAGRREALDFVVRMRTGSLFVGNTAEYHAHVLAIHGYGEWRQLAVALAMCRPGDTIIEVGANVGTETVAYADIVGPTGRVLAFEPLVANQRVLQHVLAVAELGNATLYPYAAGDGERTVRFARPPTGDSSGIGHVLGPTELATGTTTYAGRSITTVVDQVRMRPLDALVHGDVRLIAMDAEGSELAILHGARGVIRRSSPAIILEANREHQRRAGEDLSKLLTELGRLGYRTFELSRFGLHEVEEPLATKESATWLAVPRDQSWREATIKRMLRLCGLTPFVAALNPLSPRSRRRAG